MTPGSPDQQDQPHPSEPQDRADQRDRPEQRALRLVLAAHPSSVPAARHFLVDGLRGWGRDDLVDDVGLVGTELASNAVLHSGSRLVDLTLEGVPGGVRVVVADAGEVPAAAVVPRATALTPTAGLDPVLDTDAATGRGLVLVTMLASAWGVDETEPGKRVWAEFTAEGERARPELPPRPTRPPGSGVLPPGWHCVQLLGCPVALSIRQDDHLDALIRELQLVDGGATGQSGELAGVIAALLGRHAHARHLGRQVAQDAAARGQEVVDIAMPVPAQAATDVRDLDRAVQEADALCRQERLLTLGSAPDVRLLRRWMVEEFAAQIERTAPARPYEAFLTGTPEQPILRKGPE